MTAPRTSRARTATVGGACVLAALYAAAALVPATQLGESIATSVMQIVMVTFALTGALLGAWRSSGSERWLFGATSVSIAAFDVAFGIKLYFLVGFGRLTVSPSPDDLWYYIGLLALLVACVLFGRPMPLRGPSALGRLTDLVIISVLAFTLTFVLVLRPLGIVGPGVSGLRTAIFMGYSCIPVTLGLYPLLFPRAPLRGWRAVMEAGLLLAGCYVIIQLLVVGTGGYRPGSASLLSSDLVATASLMLSGGAGAWRATEPRRSTTKDDEPGAVREEWPLTIALALAFVGLPLGIYSTLRWNDATSSLISGGLTSVLTLLLVVRTAIMRLELAQLSEHAELLQRYRTLVENGPGAVFVLDEEGIIRYANGRAAALADAHAPADLFGIDVGDLVESREVAPREFRPLEELVRRFAADPDDPPGPLPPALIELRTFSGRRIVVERTAAPVRWARKPALLVMAKDVSATVEARRSAEEYDERLRALAAELVAAETREQRRLAETLHGQLTQVIGDARRRLAAGVAAGWVEGGDADVAAGMLADAMESVRALSTELAPPKLYGAGLADALTELAATVTAKMDVPCSYEGDPTGPLSDAQLALLYRSVRELVLNAVKHASTPAIRVIAHRTDDELAVSVHDDGCGFDFALVEASSSRTFGLFSVAESLGVVGGSLEVDSAPGRGTIATVRIPVATGGGK